MSGNAKTAAEQEVEALSIAAEYPTDGLPRPEAVNYTRIDRVGAEVQLSIGYVDLNALVRLIERAKKGERGEPSVRVEALHRLVFSPEAFARLKQQVDQIAAQLATPEVPAGTTQE